MSKVAVGMSGGVDSSVTVHLLQKAGHEVVGIHLKLTPESGRDESAARDAKAVADQFGIPFHIVDGRELFKKEVMQGFAESYLHQTTPNPCIHCNAVVKFGFLWQEAQRLGCTHLATGHYARVEERNGEFQLLKGANAKKDQSYFLYRINPEVLPHVMMPIGNYSKDETRAIAEEMGILTAKKKESQEICFIPNDDYIAFLEQFCPDKLPKTGTFVDKNGKPLGTHQGNFRYTIGQRRGLGLALGYPAYVTGFQKEDGAVIVGIDQELWHQGLIADRLNFLSAPKQHGRALIKIRSRDAGTYGDWHIDNDRLYVHFDTPVRAITPGQSVVLYDEERVLGGGIILTHTD